MNGQKWYEAVVRKCMVKAPRWHPGKVSPLLYVQFRSCILETIERTIKELNTQLDVTVGSFTCQLQPLDVSINKFQSIHA
jgi:hypothetical protein